MCRVVLIGDKYTPWELVENDIRKYHSIDCIFSYGKYNGSEKLLNKEELIKHIDTNPNVEVIIVAVDLSRVSEMIQSILKDKNVCVRALPHYYYSRMPWLHRMSVSHAIYLAMDTKAVAAYYGRTFNLDFVLAAARVLKRLPKSLCLLFKDWKEKNLARKGYICEDELLDLPILDLKKPELNYIELMLSMHCNLKCRYCNHYSNFVKPEFPQIENVKSDLDKMASLYRNITMIRLLGGEPFLNKDISKYICYIRKLFPFSTISILSNGLLIPKVDQEILRVISENDVQIDVTSYPPTLEIRDLVENICAKNMIKVSFSKKIDYFWGKWDASGSNDAKQSYEHCDASYCHLLLDGKISLCPVPILYDKYKSVLNRTTDYDPSEDIIDLKTTHLSAEEIKEKLSKQAYSCKYCKIGQLKFIPWEGNCIELMDDQGA